MSRIRLERRHSLGLEGARDVAERVAADLQREHGVRSRWHGSELHFDRPGLSGRLMVGESTLDLEVKLGMLLSPIRGALESAMIARLDRELRDDRA